MTKKLLSNVYFQVLLVKKIENERIITWPTHAQTKKGAQINKALRCISTERSALGLVTNFCKRSNKNKGLPLNEKFMGVVVKRSEMVVQSGGNKIITTSLPQNNNKIAKGKPTKKGSGMWLFYINPSRERFHIVTILNPNGDKRYIGEKV